MDYKIKLYTHLDEELKKIWFEIEKYSDHKCFNSLSWIENYISSFHGIPNNLQLRIFIIFLKNEPVCVFPFEIIKKFKINLLQLACDLKSDFNTPILKKNFSFEEKSFQKIWNEILKMIPEVDIIYLKKQINYFETLNNPFINFLKNSKEGSIQQILLPNIWSDYTYKILKKKFYQDLLRTKRLIKKNGKVEFIIAKSATEKREIIDILINQKKIDLAKKNINSFTSKDINFYNNFEEYKNREYTIQVSAIKLNGEVVAAHWGVITNKCYYYLLPSMKEGDIRRFSPGKLLLSILIRWSISKKIKFFDFGLGEEFYKKNWSNKNINIYNHIRLKKIKGIFFFMLLKLRQTIKLIKNKHR